MSKEGLERKKLQFSAKPQNFFPMQSTEFCASPVKPFTQSRPGISKLFLKEPATYMGCQDEGCPMKKKE